MARVNPQIFEPFVDSNGGEWIRIKTGTYENVVWRPIEMAMDAEQEDKLNFKIELLEGEGFKKVEDFDTQFERICGKIIYDILEATAEQNGNR